MCPDDVKCFYSQNHQTRSTLLEAGGGGKAVTPSPLPFFFFGMTAPMPMEHAVRHLPYCLREELRCVRASVAGGREGRGPRPSLLHGS